LKESFLRIFKELDCQKLTFLEGEKGKKRSRGRLLFVLDLHFGHDADKQGKVGFGVQDHIHEGAVEVNIR
jgi:hypothetical protein